MRLRRTRKGLAVRAVAGANVVMLGIDLPQADCDGLMGFGIHRTDHTEDEAYWLNGTKTFAETDPHFAAGATYPTRDHPIQGFTWSDFSAKPSHTYTYRIVAWKGAPASLKAFREVEVTVDTEGVSGDGHHVFFNRGAAASQEYARRFDPLPPLDKAPADDPRWAWLSRGAAEAIQAFIARAAGPGHGLRVSAYEFRLPAVAQALQAARQRGVDVRVLYDGNANAPDKKGRVFPRDDNRDCCRDAAIEDLRTERVTRADVKSPPISHHKFIVWTRAGKAQAVLTGSTNFSLGGVFGQSNVVHVVDHKAVAASYLKVWDALVANPDWKSLKQTLAAVNDLPADLPEPGTRAVFSPQPDDAALRLYARLATQTDGALFMTFAFGMNELFKGAYLNGRAPLRYALMDKLLPSGVRADQRAAKEAQMLALRRKVENRLAVGNRILTNRFDRWLAERLTGLNDHVQFIHTKFMLLDPLGNDPIVIAGSANFSDASTVANDENMLVIRGDRRVADIYVGEYMRLWNHYAFREWLASADGEAADAGFKHLDTTNRWWKQYFGTSARARQRRYFADSSA
jgi:phosphatidylserine/phosphatidylglycerophosphate/cardiolipin synthase-like enzyme